jgi:putative ABC transport system substrate-binding protein
MKRREFIGLLGGVAIASPFEAPAQQRAIPVVGFLHPGSPGPHPHLMSAFHEGLAEAGFVEGRNMAMEYRWAEDRYDRLPLLAADLARRQVTVIAVAGTGGALAAKAATSTIPIVFNFASDPVRFGLVASLGRPGGNITGISSLSVELGPKQLELLHRLVPNASSLALLVNPTNSILSETISNDVRAAAQILGLRIHILHASTEDDLREAFATLVKLRTDGLVISPDTFLDNRSKQIAALSLQHAVPSIYQFREFAAAGGLMSYGTIHTGPYRAAGIYTGKILNGVNAGDLPVQQPNRFELVINLKTAKALGLTVPVTILARANEVIG